MCLITKLPNVFFFFLWKYTWTSFLFEFGHVKDRDLVDSVLDINTASTLGREGWKRVKYITERFINLCKFLFGLTCLLISVAQINKRQSDI